MIPEIEKAKSSVRVSRRGMLRLIRVDSRFHTVGFSRGTAHMLRSTVFTYPGKNKNDFCEIKANHRAAVITVKAQANYN